MTFKTKNRQAVIANTIQIARQQQANIAKAKQILQEIGKVTHGRKS